jgi:hypothetical protein
MGLPARTGRATVLSGASGTDSTVDRRRSSYRSRDAWRLGRRRHDKNDKPMMSPERVLELWPSPVYIQYQ